MSHRVDLKIMGYESVKYGTESEIKNLAKKFDDKEVTKQVVKLNDNLFELYVKK